MKDFRGDKTFTALGQAAEFEFEFKIEPQHWPAGHLAIVPEGYSRRQSKVIIAKTIAKLLGQHSSTPLPGLMGKHRHRLQKVQDGNKASVIYCG